MYLGLVVGVILYLSGFTVAIDISECSTLDVEGARYVLTSDIIDASETCIRITSNDITLDCQGHSIDGLGSDLIYVYGIKIDMDSSTTTTIPTGCTNNTAITGFYTMTSNTTLCSDEVYNAQITVDADNVTLDCNNALLNGSGLTSVNYTCDVWSSTEPITLGIYTCNHSGIVIKNCRIAGYTGGIELIYSSSSLISNNTLWNNNGGISLLGSIGGVVSGNEVHSNTDFGISIISSPSIVEHNHVYSNDGYGISITFTDNSTVINNTVSDNELAGISLVLSSQNQIANNSILNNMDDGIELLWTSNSNNISRNLIKGNNIGICLNYTEILGFDDEVIGHTDPNENNSIVDNDILDNTLYGIYSAESKSTILGNKINFNNLGIFFDNSNSSVVSENEVCSNTVLDFSLYQSYGNSGYANNCSNPDGWNDNGVTGCTYSCSELCDLPGDSPPCGVVTLSEVVDFINLWSQGQAELEDVVNLINAWAGS